MLQQLKAIFFDLDDTLINFGGVTEQAWILTCENLLNVYPELTVDAHELAHEIVARNEAFWSDEENRPKGNVDFAAIRRELIQNIFNDLGVQHPDAVEFLVSQYAVYKEEAVYLYEDVHETLAKLKAMGKKLVAITNGDGQRQREKLQRFELTPYFDAILIEGEQGVGKPTQQAYQNALDICGVTASEASMVGDNYLWEVEAPKKYGLKGVWANTLGKELPPERTVEPDLIITRIHELLEW